MTHPRGLRTGGFSLLEMMIAVAILSLISSMVFVVLSGQRKALRGGVETMNVQEDSRLSLDTISFDTRNAGMLVPRQTAVASVDGGATAADRFCVSDGTYFPIPAAGVPDTFWDNLSARFQGSTVIGVPTNSVVVNSLDVDGRGGAVDFVARAGVILADANGDRSYCSRIETIDTGTTKRLNLASGHNVPTGLFTGTVIAVPAIVYEIVATPTTTTLLRNGNPLSTQVEDLQVQYWIDVSPTDGVVGDAREWPIDDLNAVSPTVQDLTRIRRVRLHVIGRAQLPEDGATVQARYNYPGVANRNEGTTFDSFKRQLFSASILPRNLLESGEVPNVP